MLDVILSFSLSPLKPPPPSLKFFHNDPSSTQMIVDIIHPGRANVAKSENQGVIGGMHKTDSKLVVLFGFRTKFGGGKSTGFCVIYDNEDALLKFEPKHRLVRQGLAEKKERSRKALKEAKEKGKKVRGTGASIAKHKAKRAAQARDRSANTRKLVHKSTPLLKTVQFVE
jgi:small subunit ribosomal protein S24e